jgi:hypothetical protein
MISAATLNQVATLLNTTDKNVIISAVMKTLVASGMAVDAAFDFCFGEGAYSKFAGRVYKALRAA